MHTNFFIGKPEWKRPRRNIGVNGDKMLNYILRELGGRCGLDEYGSG
jgi:hypothetical protein